MPNTSFDPAKHGFHFSNNDITWSLGPFSSKALCGGMAYAAIDYFRAQITIPEDTTPPAELTPLHNYIYERQKDAHFNTVPKFGEAWFLEGGVNTSKLIDEYNKLVSILSKGQPIPICMYGPMFGHHLVAIGCEPLTILAADGFVPPGVLIRAYDPNSPGKTATIKSAEVTLGPFLTLSKPGLKNSESSKLWNGFFVDDGFKARMPSVVTGQRGWQRCTKCQGLFFFWNPSKGVCPKDGKAHSGGGMTTYALPLNGGSGQAKWKWCQKCQGLYFSGRPGSAGVCPAKGSHDGSFSGDYAIPHNGGLGETGWRWCKKCEGMFFVSSDSATAAGVCPVTDLHDATASGRYSVPFVSAFPPL